VYRRDWDGLRDMERVLYKSVGFGDFGVCQGFYLGLLSRLWAGLLAVFIRQCANIKY